MSDKITLKSTPRTILGKKVSSLRAKNLIPANINIAGKESLTISLPQADFTKVFAKAGETGLIYLDIEGNGDPHTVLVDEVSHHPVSGQILHVVFRQVSLKEKIKAEIPVVVEGENKISGAVLVLVKDVIEVEALPTDLPEKFVIKAEELTQIGQTKTISDIDYDHSKVTVLMDEKELESPIVILQEVKEEKEEVPAPSAEASTESPTPTEGEKSSEDKSEEK